MRKQDVPQEDNRMHPGERKLAYAVDERGEYVRVASTGWKVEEFVTSLALDDFEEAARDAWQRARDGVTSPLEYHMYAQRMDVQLLAQTAGRWQLTVRRHLKPRVFARLSEAALQRYADVLGVDVRTLRSLPEAPLGAPGGGDPTATASSKEGAS